MAGEYVFLLAHTRFVVMRFCLLLNCHFSLGKLLCFFWKLRICILASVLSLSFSHFTSCCFTMYRVQNPHYFAIICLEMLRICLQTAITWLVFRMNLLLRSQNAIDDQNMSPRKTTNGKNYTQQTHDVRRIKRNLTGNQKNEYGVCLVRRTKKIMCNLYRPPASAIEIAISTINTHFVHSHYSFEMWLIKLWLTTACKIFM